MAFVQQKPVVFSMSVYDNIACGLRWRHRKNEIIRQKVEDVLELVAMVDHRNRNAKKLSGGETQRVAIARALATEPEVLLLDEPLSNLNAKLREVMRTEIRCIQQTLGITSVYVTHDQVEAMTLSDRVVVINEGRIEQIGTPPEIYRRPQSAFVADFIGSTNFVEATVRGIDNGAVAIEALGQTLTIPKPDHPISQETVDTLRWLPQHRAEQVLVESCRRLYFEIISPLQ